MKTKKKFFTLMTLLLAVCSGAWADMVPVTLFSTDFTDSKYNVTFPTEQSGSVTVDDNGTTVTIKGYKSSAWTWSATDGIKFTGSNPNANEGTITATSPNYVIAIPLTGVNGEITVTTDTSTKWYYSYTTDAEQNTIVGRTQATSNSTFTITGLTNSNVTLYFGSSAKKIKNITITTPPAISSKVLSGININDEAWDINGLSDNKATISTEYNGAPSVDFIYTINYSNSSTDTGQKENIEAVNDGTGNFVATSTALTNNVTLTFTNVNILSPSDLAVASGKGTINTTVGADNYTLTQGTDFTTSSDGTISYTSSIPGVAYVDASTGELQFKGAGTTTITLAQAESASYEGGSVTFTVNVLPSECLNLGDKDEAITQLKKGWAYDSPYFDTENKKVIIGAFAAYSTGNQGYQKWIATSMNTDDKSDPDDYTVGGTSNKASWSSSAPFIGGSGYFRDDTNPRHATTNSSRPWTVYNFRVKGITAAEALVKGNNASRYVTIAAYEITDGALAATAAKSANTSDGNEAKISVTELDSNKEYLITVGNTIYGSNLNFYEIAFTASGSDIEIPSNRITTSAAGWASYTPMYNVSATIYKPGSSSAATDIKMYTVESVTGNDATMHEVTSGTEKGMKADNGYFLKGAANTTYRTTATGGNVTVPETNLIKAQTTTGTVKTEGNLVRYALLTYDEDHYGLYKLNATGVTIPAGKAYLEVDTSVGEARVFDFLNFNFDDGETTSIDKVAPVTSDMNGIKKYIENGKLVIVKNGAKFNVAGAQIK